MKTLHFRIDDFGVYLLQMRNGAIVRGLIFDWAHLGLKGETYGKCFHFPKLSYIPKIPD